MGEVTSSKRLSTLLFLFFENFNYSVLLFAQKVQLEREKFHFIPEPK